jgi:hypothetical protein
MRVLEPGGDRDLPEEALDPDRAGDLPVQQLDRDGMPPCPNSRVSWYRPARAACSRW